MNRWLYLGVLLIPVGIIISVFASYYIYLGFIALNSNHPYWCNINTSTECPLPPSSATIRENALIYVIENALLLSCGIASLAFGVFFVVKRRLPSSI